MPNHKQVEVKINDDYSIWVDEGLEDIIKNFFHWNIETTNSCIDNNGSIWISFPHNNPYSYEWKTFLQVALNNSNEKIAKGDETQTLWDFLIEKCEIKLAFCEEIIFDPNKEDEASGTGALQVDVNLRFPKELLKDFKELFYQVFPPK